LHAYELVLALLLLGACSINPISLHRELNFFDEEHEVSLGRKADLKVVKQFGLYPDAKLQRYVNEVGQRVAKASDRPRLHYHFRVLDDPMVNAFALPGGYIYVTRGLLAEINSEAELAAVLGHEITHVVCRDPVNRLSQQIGAQALLLASLASPSSREFAAAGQMLIQSVMLGYSRQKEFQADAMGLEYAFRAGYDPLAMARFLRHLARRSWAPPGHWALAMDHPEAWERVEQAQAKAKVLISLRRAWQGGDPVLAELHRSWGRVGEADYKRHLEGLVYGPKGSTRKLKIYRVRSGDTLRSIAGKLLGTAERWREIADLNDLQTDRPPVGTYLKVVVP